MASAVSAIFILDLKGKVLISRNYRGDIPMSAVEKFLPLVLEAEEDSQAPAPCFTDDGINYLYIRHNNLFCKSPHWLMGKKETGLVTHLPSSTIARPFSCLQKKENGINFSHQPRKNIT